MSHVQQIGCKALWSIHGSHAVEPFAYISQMGETYRVEDVDDGDLGSRRTLDDAVALANQHSAVIAAQEAAHTARVETIIASERAA